MFRKNKVKSNAEIMKNFISMKIDLLKALEKNVGDLKDLETTYDADMSKLRAEMLDRDLKYSNDLCALELEREGLEKSLKFVEDVIID